MKGDKKKIGEMLIEAGCINEWQLNSALGEQKQWGGRLASIMVGMGFVEEKTIASVLEKQLGQDCISLEGREILPDVLKRMKVDIAKKYGVIPIAFEKGTLTVATADPTDLHVLDELGFMLNVKIRPALALESGIRKAIALHYEGIVIARNIPSIKAERTGEMKLTSDVLGTGFPGATGIDRAWGSVETKDVTTKAVVEALLALLMEKGVITKGELVEKLKGKRDQR